MNVYKDFVVLHDMTLDPRDVHLFADWLLSCEPESQAYKIGEAMQAAINNYLEKVALDIYQILDGGQKND